MINKNVQEEMQMDVNLRPLNDETEIAVTFKNELCGVNGRGLIEPVLLSGYPLG